MLPRENIFIQEALERKILHGLSCEWENAIWVLTPEQKQLMKKPLFSLKDMACNLAHWSGEKHEICLSRKLVYNYSWDTVREILFHEMAHQYTEMVLGAHREPPHGPMFQKACRLLRANPKASGTYQPLRDHHRDKPHTRKDKLMIRVKKLMALAESKNRHEAEAAMLKAHELIKKYNIDLLSGKKNRRFVSIFLGKPALRHHREEYHLAHLIQNFYFVQGIWVSAYVIEKGKMGRVLEISGTLQNMKIAGYVYDFVRHFINAQWKLYNTGNTLNRYRKTDFAVGIIEGFRMKLEIKDPIFNKKSNHFDLIKIEDPLLKKYMKYKYPHTVSFNRNTSGQDKNIYEDGKRIGKKLVLYKGISEKGKEKRLLTK